MVAQRLVDVASFVVGVGRSCEMHELSEEDLAHLQTALQPLQRCV